MKRLNKFILFSVVMILLVLSGCAAQNSGNINVKTQTASLEKITSSVHIAGVLLPSKTVNVSSQMGAKVVSADFSVGDKVKAGQTLIKLDTSTLEVQLQQANAAYQTANNQIALTKISLDNAKRTLDQTTQLFNQGAASQSQLDSAKSAYDTLTKQYETSSGPAIAQSKASLDMINIQIANSSIKSPIDGIITNKNISEGEMASIGSPLISIADTSTLKLKGTISQSALPFIKVSQKANIHIDIYPDKTFDGVVTALGPISVSTGTYFPIEMTMQNIDAMASGLSAQADIEITGNEKVVVPLSAIIENNGESYIFVIENGVAKKRTVTVGLKNDIKAEILSGLKEGENVAVSNVNSLFDNMPVNIQKD